MLKAGGAPSLAPDLSSLAWFEPGWMSSSLLVMLAGSRLTAPQRGQGLWCWGVRGVRCASVEMPRLETVFVSPRVAGHLPACLSLLSPSSPISDFLNCVKMHTNTISQHAVE